VAALQQLYIFMPQKVKDCYLVYLLRLQEYEVEEDDEEENKSNKKKKIRGNHSLL
jgi:hypothetical protein